MASPRGDAASKNKVASSIVQNHLPACADVTLDRLTATLIADDHAPGKAHKGLGKFRLVPRIGSMIRPEEENRGVNLSLDLR